MAATHRSIDIRDAYIDLLKLAVTNYPYLGGNAAFDAFRCVDHYDLDAGRWRIDRMCCPATLLNKHQLDLIEHAVRHVDANRIPGDLLEAGIWRGGAVIFMRGLLTAFGHTDRRVIAADSFAGIPLNQRGQDDPVDAWTDRWIATLDEVRGLIDRFGMLDDRIEFCEGFFEDSLSQLEGRRYAVIRLDSDSHDSVETSLRYLYPNLSQGGVAIIDDWHLSGCRNAVQEYFERHGLDDDIRMHNTNAYWLKRQPYDAPR